MNKIFLIFAVIFLFLSEDLLAKSEDKSSSDDALSSYSGKGFSIGYLSDVFDVKESSNGFLELTKKSLNPRENLSEVSVFIESTYLPFGKKCSASLFKSVLNGYLIERIKIVNEGGVSYSVTSTKEDKKNRGKNEEIWAIVDSNPCVAVKYFYETVDGGMFDDGGGKREYNREALSRLFAEVRKSVKFSRIAKNQVSDPNESISKIGNEEVKTYRYKQGRSGFLVSYPQDYFAENNSIFDSSYFTDFGRNNGIIIYKKDPDVVQNKNSIVNPTLAIEMLPIFSGEQCRAKLFVNNDLMLIKERRVEEGDKIYSVIDSYDRYGDDSIYGREIIWAFSQGNSCVGVRYFYATNLSAQNFDGDRDNLLNIFDRIRRSLVVK
jgi:hypothetical protein